MLNDYIPNWGRPRTFSTDLSSEFEAGVGRFQNVGFSQGVYLLVHPQTNGMAERVNYVSCQVLSRLLADVHKKRDELSVHASDAQNSKVSRGNGLAHKSCTHTTVSTATHDDIEMTGCRGHQGLNMDQMAY